MAERILNALPEPELERALRDLGPSIAWPTAGTAAPGLPDLATSVRFRIEALPAPAPQRTLPDLAVRLIPWRGRPLRRALVLALVALLALAALAGAVGLGLPGLRLILGGAPGGPSPAATPTAEPSASEPAALGATMGLGEPLDVHDTDGLTARAGFPVTLPVDPAIGAPEAAYLDEGRGNQVTLLWPVGPGLPATHETTVGLLLSQFEGTVNEGFFTKSVAGGTVVERIRVGDRPGFWISGQPHVLFWDGPTGTVDDARRWVGDVLLWSNGPITFRLESGLGRDQAIRIAESLP
jgi:hypothetical protein